MPTNDFEKFLSKENFYINDTIRGFLSEFGGLCLEIYIPAPAIAENRCIPFGMLSNDLFMSTDWMEEYEGALKNEKLVPIGIDHSLTIFMSYSGKFFGGFGAYFCRLYSPTPII